MKVKQENTHIYGEAPPDDTGELVARASEGDAEAFGILVQRNEAFVYNVAFSLLGSRDDALDASQEAFIKAYRSIRAFRGDCRFQTWLYRITVNAAKDMLRHKAKRRTTSLTDYDDEDDETKNTDIPDDDPGSSPQESLENSERTAAVRQAIERLSPDHRTIVLLRDIDGYSYEAISDMLGLEIGTVKSRLNRARAAIKDYLSRKNVL